MRSSLTSSQCLLSNFLITLSTDVYIRIDRTIPAGIRCTVQLNPEEYHKRGKKRIVGKVESPSIDCLNEPNKKSIGQDSKNE